LYKRYKIFNLKLNKDILIGIFDGSFIKYNKYNVKIEYNNKIIFYNYILNINLDNMKGKIIMKELVEKVFHPMRLYNICDKYNIDFIDLKKKLIF